MLSANFMLMGGGKSRRLEQNWKALGIAIQGLTISSFPRYNSCNVCYSPHRSNAEEMYRFKQACRLIWRDV